MKCDRFSYESFSRTCEKTAAGATQSCTDGRTTRAGRTSTVLKLSSDLFSCFLHSSIQVVSVPTVDEQGYQSYPAEPPPQYRQAIYQQHAYQQKKIPNQNQISTISQVPIYQTIPSNTMLNSEAMNAKLNLFSGAQSDSIPYAAQIPKSLLFKDVKVKEDTFTLNNDNRTTILFDPLISKGIIKFEVLNVSTVGIADETVKYGRKEFPSARGYENIVRQHQNGWIGHTGEWIEGNARFWNAGDRVALEMDMDSSPRTLTFFVNDEEQPNFVTNIPTAVRFFVYLEVKDQAFKVLKFEALSAPTAKHSTGSRAWEYGTKWEKQMKDLREEENKK
ncbi:MAG: hypothetical protein EZS28_001202 [Streblomastix strix]|uniref:SPRY domain-containing protein n=1 Tax=Streblomastix strix TaxID=222440 RepID=A0A5J4X9R7_9EUKA|nr:MAG: hypothetical protein EZS28_001202 [Streblomastix strix]